MIFRAALSQADGLEFHHRETPLDMCGKTAGRQFPAAFVYWNERPRRVAWASRSESQLRYRAQLASKMLTPQSCLGDGETFAKEEVLNGS